MAAALHISMRHPDQEHQPHSILPSVRGFQQNSLGPRDINGDYIGGNKRLVMNTEVLFPLPGVKTDKSVRLSGFVDAGNVWAAGNFSLSTLRASTGIAVSWFSPVGPLRFSLAKPLTKYSADKPERFQFLLGRVF